MPVAASLSVWEQDYLKVTVFTEREMIQFSDKILIQTLKDAVVACYFMWLCLPHCLLRLAATTVTVAIVLLSVSVFHLSSSRLTSSRAGNFACFI